MTREEKIKAASIEQLVTSLGHVIIYLHENSWYVEFEEATERGKRGQSLESLLKKTLLKYPQFELKEVEKYVPLSSVEDLEELLSGYESDEIVLVAKKGNESVWSAMLFAGDVWIEEAADVNDSEALYSSLCTTSSINEAQAKKEGIQFFYYIK